jgi:hypothetical protein
MCPGPLGGRGFRDAIQRRILPQQDESGKPASRRCRFSDRPVGRAFNANDVDSLVELYAPDAILIGQHIKLSALLIDHGATRDLLSAIRHSVFLGCRTYLGIRLKYSLALVTDHQRVTLTKRCY